MPTPPRDSSSQRPARPAQTPPPDPPQSSGSEFYAGPPVEQYQVEQYQVEPSGPDPAGRSGMRFVLPWAIAGALVLGIAVTAGLMTAYLVANSRAVPPPGGALASPTPRRTPVVTLAPGETPAATGEATTQPRRTPTPPVVVTPAPTPFVHVVARGESLTVIADLYCTTVEEIVALNEIRNPNNIQVGREILIPGGAGCASPAP